MGRSRKKRRPAGERRPGASSEPSEPVAATTPSGAETMRRGYARGRERDEHIREGLVALAPGERPGAVTVAAIVAFVLAVANVVAALVIDIDDTETRDAIGPTILISTILLIAAVGMWRAKYWAVLGFQVIVGLQLVVYSIAITRVEKLWLGLLLVVLIGALGYLFWKLIRAMARLQMPERPPPPPLH